MKHICTQFLPITETYRSMKEIKISRELIMDEYCIVHEKPPWVTRLKERTAGYVCRCPTGTGVGVGGGCQGNLSTSWL